MPNFQGFFRLSLGVNMTKIVDFFEYMCYHYYDIVGGIYDCGENHSKRLRFGLWKHFPELTK